MPHPQLIITLDGPAGAGKTTVSRMLAQKLGYRYLDTGALYRAVAVAVHRAAIDPADEKALSGLCKDLEIRMEQDRLFLADTDITDALRTPAITRLASAVSARKEVRAALFGLQRQIGEAGGVVAEGRDMGTVVFPEADVKFFLDASVQTRALRRFQQYPDSGQSLEAVEADIRKRDQDDQSRDVAPLKPADDAIILDSSNLTADAVVNRMIRFIGPLLKNSDRC